MSTGLSPLRAITVLGQAVFLEILRRKDVYVLFILMLVFLLGVGVMRAVGIPDPETGTFLLNLGLYAASLSAHLIALGFGSRAIMDEIENRTLYPLLATPLSRGLFVVGKWLATWLAASVVLLVLGALAWLAIPHLEAYHGLTLVQTVLFQVGSLGMLVAVVMLLSLCAPKGVAAVGGALWFFLGGRLLALLMGAGGGLGRVAGRLACYLPDFDRLNGITRYTDGIGPLGMVATITLAGYVAVACGVLVSLCAWRFGRRAL